MGKFITLREEFESEIGADRFTDQQYIEWLEKIIEQQRVVKNRSIPDVVNKRELLVDFAMKRNNAPDFMREQYERDADEYLAKIN